MDPEKRKALEESGWRFGDAADFLGMDEKERQLHEARVALALAVRRRRRAMHMSQRELARMMKTSQPRVAKIESAASDVSLDQLVRAFTSIGGRIVFKQTELPAKTKVSPKGKPTKGKKPKRAEVQIELIGEKL
jgi:transcriptional regulator with XRE-family HTH domain